MRAWLFGAGTGWTMPDERERTLSGSQPIALPPLPGSVSASLPPAPPAGGEASGPVDAPSLPIDLPDLDALRRAAAAAEAAAAARKAAGQASGGRMAIGQSSGGHQTIGQASGGRPAAGHSSGGHQVLGQGSGARPPVAAPNDPGSESSQARKGVLSFLSVEGSAAHDAEVMARIMAGRQERDAEAEAVVARVAVAAEHERRETARVRQRIAIEMYMAAQLRQAAEETPLQRVLRETAESFMALGICPDHLEYLPDIGKFCSWGGQVYDHAAIHTLQDRRGQPIYVLGDSPHGPGTVCWSKRERGWRLDRPLDPAVKLTPTDRLVPIPMRRDDATYRFSAKRASTIIMEEGLATIYVAGNAVYMLSHLQAAHHRHVASRPSAPGAGQASLAGRFAKLFTKP